MRDQRNRTDAQDLHQCIDEEAGVARRSHARNSSIAERCDEIQVDQLADHDRDHADDDGRRHDQDVAHNGAACQVFHLSHPLPWRGLFGHPSASHAPQIHSAAVICANSVTCRSNKER
jgi:hypothetical protein